MALHPRLLLVLLSAPLAAQTLSVSPTAYGATEGNASLSYIFTSGTNQTQQVHGDLRGTPRVMTALSFRRDGLATQTTGMSRNIDMDITVGDANFADVGIDFANNYTGAPANVFVRKVVSTPNWQNAPAVPPAPFDFTLTFDVPFVSTGVQDFAWQMKCYSNTGVTADAMRADLATPAFSNSPTPSFGTACTATGASNTYQLLGTMGTNINPEFRWSVQGFPTPPNCALNVLLVGATDPDLALPGLCNNLRTSAEISLPMPASDANGTWTLPLLYIPYANHLVGATFYEQAYSLDVGQPGLPVVGTVGKRLTFQGVPSTGVAAMIKSVRDVSPNATNATVGQSISDGGFVVQITH